ncbi:MAG TPA: hypothetical protein VF797_09715, partial [Noviherbaspirillum sp.]
IDHMFVHGLKDLQSGKTMDTATWKRHRSIVLSTFMTRTLPPISPEAKSHFAKCNATAGISKKWHRLAPCRREPFAWNCTNVDAR